MSTITIAAGTTFVSTTIPTTTAYLVDGTGTDADDRGDGNLRVLPKQPGEFVCRSCFLVKSESQLADPARMLCRDCV